MQNFMLNTMALADFDLDASELRKTIFKKGPSHGRFLKSWVCSVSDRQFSRWNFFNRTSGCRLFWCRISCWTRWRWQILIWISLSRDIDRRRQKKPSDGFFRTTSEHLNTAEYFSKKFSLSFMLFDAEFQAEHDGVGRFLFGCIWAEKNDF